LSAIHTKQPDLFVDLVNYPSAKLLPTLAILEKYHPKEDPKEVLVKKIFPNEEMTDKRGQMAKALITHNPDFMLAHVRGPKSPTLSKFLVLYGDLDILSTELLKPHLELDKTSKAGMKIFSFVYLAVLFSISFFLGFGFSDPVGKEAMVTTIIDTNILADLAVCKGASEILPTISNSFVPALFQVLNKIIISLKWCKPLISERNFKQIQPNFSCRCQLVHLWIQSRTGFSKL
jgi:hypothetical protein